MIDIDGDIWPRKGKGRAEEVIEGLRGTSAVLKHPNSESSLDRGVSGASHFPGVRGTKLLYIRRKLFLSSSHSRDATSNMGGIPTFFCVAFAPQWRPFRRYFLHFVVRHYLGCIWFDFSFPESPAIGTSVPDMNTWVPVGRSSRGLTDFRWEPCPKICLTTLTRTPQDQKGRLNEDFR